MHTLHTGRSRQTAFLTLHITCNLHGASNRSMSEMAVFRLPKAILTKCCSRLKLKGHFGFITYHC